VSSELQAAELESKRLARIRQFEFSAKGVEQVVVTWPADFLPSQAPGPGPGARIAHPFARNTTR
jgi:hypothetical protein